jgi:hypothetical protein
VELCQFDPLGCPRVLNVDRLKEGFPKCPLGLREIRGVLGGQTTLLSGVFCFRGADSISLVDRARECSLKVLNVRAQLFDTTSLLLLARKERPLMQTQLLDLRARVYPFDSDTFLLLFALFETHHKSVLLDFGPAEICDTRGKLLSFAVVFRLGLPQSRMKRAELSLKLGLFRLETVASVFFSAQSRAHALLLCERLGQLRFEVLDSLDARLS